MTSQKAFTGFYYPAFSNDRSSLANVYTDQSCMTFEGAQFQGKAPILEKLMSLPFQKVNHQITTIDSQPIIGVDDNKVSVKFTGGIIRVPHEGYRFLWVDRRYDVDFLETQTSLAEGSNYVNFRSNRTFLS